MHISLYIFLWRFGRLPAAPSRSDGFRIRKGWFYWAANQDPPIAVSAGWKNRPMAYQRFRFKTKFLPKKWGESLDMMGMPARRTSSTIRYKGQRDILERDVEVYNHWWIYNYCWLRMVILIFQTRVWLFWRRDASPQPHVLVGGDVIKWFTVTVATNYCEDGWLTTVMITTGGFGWP